MIKILTKRKLSLSPNQFTGLQLFHTLCYEVLVHNNHKSRIFKSILSITESLNLLYRIDYSHLILLMTQTSGKIYEYLMLNSSKRLSSKTECILFVNRRHPFMKKQFIVEERKITSPIFFKVFGDYLNEIKMNPTARRELKELIAPAISFV